MENHTESYDTECSGSTFVGDGQVAPPGETDESFEDVPEVDPAPEPVADVYDLTGGECLCHPPFDGVCPVDWCRYHLDSQERKTWKKMPARRSGEVDTCSLRLAGQGGRTLEEIAVLLGLTRERVRQIEEKGLAKMTRGFIRAQLMGRAELPDRLRRRLLITKISPRSPDHGTSGVEP